MTPLLTVVAGAAGALGRYLLSGVAQRATRSDFPVGTLVVNLVGAFLLGAVAGADGFNGATVLIAFLGGFTTFSTWMVETLRLGPRSVTAFMNLTLTLVGGIAIAALGYTLTN